jgi:hypothetical protein
MRNFGSGLMTFVILASSISLTFGQDDSPSTAQPQGKHHVSRHVIDRSEDLLAESDPKPLQLNTLLQPMYTTYFVLENLDVIMVETVAYFLDDLPDPVWWFGFDMPDEEIERALREHGPII